MPIDVPGDGTVLNTSAFEFPTGRSVFAECPPFQLDAVDDLPHVPALPETLLAMEIQLQEFSVDLCSISEVVLGDLGATIQILRLAGREYGTAEDRPVRIEDCISDLGLNACLHAAASGALVRGDRLRAVLEMWAHSREIARYCRLLAEEMPGTINPDEAYLGGLLHGIGALPLVLAWRRNDMPGDRDLAALKMAERWSLPRGVKDLFRDVYLRGRNSRWSTIMAKAHRLAMEPGARCPLSNSPA